jgi:hypothetical protein
MTRFGTGMILSIALALGCSGQPKRIPLSGSVTVAGEKTDLGEIRFVPLHQDPDGPVRPTLAVVVAKGGYRVDTLGGLPEGEYRVEVEARRKTGRKVTVNTGLESAEVDEMITFSPKSFAGKESTLKLLVNDQTPNTFDIDLPSP